MVKCAVAAPPRPWEGSDQPTPYTIVNTKDGTPTTVLPLGGWKGRGLSVNLTYYRSSSRNEYSPYSHDGWLNTYEAVLRDTPSSHLINGVPSSLVLDGPDGSSRYFTTTDGQTYSEQVGYFDRLRMLAEPDAFGIPGATMAGELTDRSGLRYIFSDYETESGVSSNTEAGSAAHSGGVRPMAHDPDYYLLLRRIIDRNGNTVTVLYEGSDGTGAISAVVDATGRAIEFTDSGTQTVISDPSGRMWTLNWTSTYGDLASVVESAPGETSRTFSFGYAARTLTSLSDWKTNAEHPGQATWSFTYSNGRITQVDGPSWMAAAMRPQRKYAYGTNTNNPASLMDGGAETAIKTKTGVDGSGANVYATMLHDYDLAQGNLTHVNRLKQGEPDPYAGSLTEIVYDSTFVHLPGQFVGPKFGATVTYDSLANMKSISKTYPGEGAIATTSLSYADTNNPYLPTEIHQNGGSKAMQYDSNGNLTDVWDGNHFSPGTAPSASSVHAHYTVNSHGQIIEADPLATASPSGKSWKYTYDANGNLSGIQRPGESSASQTIHFDTLSRRDWSKRYPADTQTTYGYDGFGRLATIDYPGGSTPDISYTYNANGTLIGMVDPSGHTSWDLDALDRPLSEKKGTLNQKEIDWTYDASGRRASTANWHASSGTGEVTDYAYDDYGFLHTASGPWGNDGNGDPLKVTYDWCPCGELNSVTYPYQKTEEMSAQHGGGIHGYMITDPSAGSTIAWEQTHTGMMGYGDPMFMQGQVTSGPDGYSRDEYYLPYDPAAMSGMPDQLNRLLHEELTYSDWPSSGVSTSAFQYDYTLDDLGNRTQLKATWDVGGVSQVDTYTYTYDSRGTNRLTNLSVGYPAGPTDPYWTDFTYDAAGNTSGMATETATEEDLVTLGYSGANQLTSLTDSYSGGTTNSVQFVYDGLGRLAQKKDGSGTVLATYYYDGTTLAYETTPAGSVTYQWAGGRLLSQRPTVSGTAHTYWYLLDSLGNAKALLDGADQNRLKAVYVYDGFGNLQPSSFEDLDIENPLRYRANSGYMFLVEPQQAVRYALYNAGARTYNTDTGRWLQEDPVVGIPTDPMSFNRYLYCNADPINNADPTGLSALWDEGRNPNFVIVPPDNPLPSPSIHTNYTSPDCPGLVLCRMVSYDLPHPFDRPPGYGPALPSLCPPPPGPPPPYDGPPVPKWWHRSGELCGCLGGTALGFGVAGLTRANGLNAALLTAGGCLLGTWAGGDSADWLWIELNSGPPYAK